MLGDNDICNIIVTRKDSTTETELPYRFVRNDGAYMLNITDPDDPWYPEEDTIVGIWESEELYLAGNAPTAEYSAETLDVSVFANGGYALFIQDYEFSVKLTVNAGAKLTIDLGNCSVITQEVSATGDNTKFTVKNGTITFKSQQYYRGKDTEILFEGVHIYNKRTTFGYGSLAYKWTYRNCTLEMIDGSYFFLGANANDSASYALTFENTDIIVPSSDANYGLFYYKAQSKSSRPLTVKFDAESSIKGNVGHFFTFEEKASATFGTPILVYFEEGFTMNAKYGFSWKQVEKQADGTFVTTEGVKTANDICKMYLGDTLTSGNTQYANPTSDGTAYGYYNDMDKVNVGWYRYDANSGIWYGVPAVKNENGVATFSSANFNTLNKGETIIFAQDIITTDRITGNDVARTDITFDLGGNTMTVSGAFNLSLHVSSQYQPFNLTWKNGTINTDNNQPFYGYGHPTSVFTFDGVTVNHTRSSIIMSMYMGTWVIKNSTINAETGTAIAFEYLSESIASSWDPMPDQSVKIENSTINAAIPLRVYMAISTKLDNGKFYIKNSTITSKNHAVNVGIVKPETQNDTAENYINFLIEDSYIKAPTLVNVYGGLNGKVTVTLSDTYISNEIMHIDNVASANTEQFRVVAKTGEKIMGIDGIEGYSYYVGKITVNSGDFQANLTLHSDFNLNFHANKDTILAVYYNGTALELVDYGGMAVYSIKDIRPDTAAEALEFVVWVKQGEVIYKVPLTYSVLKYAEAVVGDGTVVNTGTKLVSAVMNYVKAAYEYVGKTAPEFEGVTYTAPTVTTPDSFSHLAIKGVQLSLDTEIGVRFNLNSAYTGALTVDGATYQIVGGKLDGTNVDYVVANVRAYEFADKGIEVSDTSDSAVYTLAHYVTYAKGENNANLEALVTALYEYSYYANEYKNN